MFCVFFFVCVQPTHSCLPFADRHVPSLWAPDEKADVCGYIHALFSLFGPGSSVQRGVWKGPIQRRSIMAVVASWALFPLVTPYICLKRTVKLCGSFSTRAICLPKRTPLPPVACDDSGEMKVLLHNPSRDSQISCSHWVILQVVRGILLFFQHESLSHWSPFPNMEYNIHSLIAPTWTGSPGNPGTVINPNGTPIHWRGTVAPPDSIILGVGRKLENPHGHLGNMWNTIQRVTQAQDQTRNPGALWCGATFARRSIFWSGSKPGARIY